MSRPPPDATHLGPTTAGTGGAPSSGEPFEHEARVLFAAGAREQAPPRLRAALLRQAHGITAARARGASNAGDKQHAHAEPHSAALAGRALPRARRRIGLALSAAAGVLGAWSFWRVPEVGSGERVLISAEHAPLAVPATPGPQRAPEAAPAPATVPRVPPAPSTRRQPEAPPERATRAVRAAKPVAAPPPALSSHSPASDDAVAGAVALDALAASAAAPAAADVRRELELLHSVQRALRAGQQQRVLELLDSPGSGLERGDFAAEARLMRIEALAGSGQRAAAASLAREFLRLFPHSLLADRVRQFGTGTP